MATEQDPLQILPQEAWDLIKREYGAATVRDLQAGIKDDEDSTSLGAADAARDALADAQSAAAALALTPDQWDDLKNEHSPAFIARLESQPHEYAYTLWQNLNAQREAEEAEYMSPEDRAVRRRSGYYADTAVGGTDMTVGDIYEIYYWLEEEVPDEYRRLNEALLANGWFGVSADADDFDNVSRRNNAFDDAVEMLVGRGESPFGDVWARSDFSAAMENPVWTLAPTDPRYKPPPEFDFSGLGGKPPSSGGGGEEPQRISRFTEAQVADLANTAAGTTFGRNASMEEQALALSVVRGLEDTQRGTTIYQPGSADLEAAFREASPEEAEHRGVESSLRMLMQLVGRR
jgi:hypothetical protein